MNDQEWILDTISTLNSEGTVESIYEALEKLSSKLGLDRCIIRNRIPDSNDFRVISEYAAQGLIPIDVLEPDMGSEASLSLVQQLLDNGQVKISDIYQAEGFTDEEIQKAKDWGTRSFLFLPLMYKKAINGMIIAIQSYEARTWTDNDAFMVKLIGETALAVWLHNKSLDALSESRQLFQWALDASNDPIWDWDILGGNIFFSPRFYELLSIEPRTEPIDIKEFMQLVHPDDIGLLEESLKDAQGEGKGSASMEFRLMTTGGEPRWILSRGNIVDLDDDGVPVRAVGTYTDITVFKRTLQQLELSQQASEAANVAKSSFLARMSHEVRTPLNAITGMLHLLQDSKLDENQQEKVTIMQRSSEQLLSIIEDVLDFSRIESGRIELEAIEFSIDEVVQNVFSMFSAEAEEKGLELLASFAHDIPETIIGDPGRLGQVITNLVSNAIKFTDEGYIQLKVICRRKSKDAVTLHFNVSDSGVGIREEQLEQLFDPYVQAELSISRTYGGSGLGLSICKSLVELMDGNIYAQSEYGQGSRFKFNINASLTANEYSVYEKHQLEMHTVRVICAGKLSAIHYEAFFQGFGITADCAYLKKLDLEELADLLEAATSYDLILVDVPFSKFEKSQLHELLDRINKVAQHQHVLLTPTFLSDSFKQVPEKWPNVRYISKPLTPIKFSSSFRSKDAEKTIDKLPAIFSLEDIQKLKGRKILLVEDNQVNSLVARGILNKYGIECDICVHGKEAVDLLYEKTLNSYDAIFMDIEMPVMNGYEATRLIRQLPSDKTIPIIAMTANTLTRDIERCFESGMDAHISKPLIPEKVLRCLLENINN